MVRSRLARDRPGRLEKTRGPVSDALVHYAEHVPPADLRRHVQCLWELRDEAPGSDIQAIYPDGRCELIAELGVPMRFHGVDGALRSDAALVFAAQQRGPIRLQAVGPVHCIAVRLTPAAGALIAGARLPALRDAAPDLRSLDAGFADAFEAATRACAGDGSAEPVWRLLRVRCATFAPDSLVERAVARIDRDGGDIRIVSLARELGIPLRSLQARFLTAVGMAPKEYARVRRLQALLRTLDDAPSSIAEAAAQHGYADQAHATREVARFGITPARLARALRDNRSGDSAIRLAAAFVRGRSGARTA